MNLKAVMQEIGDQLRTLDLPVRVYQGAPTGIKIPSVGVAVVVPLPEEFEFDATYGRGMDKATLPVMMIMASPNDARTTDMAAALASGSGTKSVKAVMGSRTAWEACDDVHVARGVFEGVSIDGVDFLAATFTVLVTGSGKG